MQRLNWDLVGRAGFACVFTTDAFRDDLYLIDPAGLVGLDGYLTYAVSEDNTAWVARDVKSLLCLSAKSYAYTRRTTCPTRPIWSRTLLAVVA